MKMHSSIWHKKIHIVHKDLKISYTSYYLGQFIIENINGMNGILKYKTNIIYIIVYKFPTGCHKSIY